MSESKAFEDALRIQAVGAGAPTLTLDDVRDRARSIRRRRAAAVAGSTAVLVAAAVVPIALLAGGGSTDTLPPADTPTVSDTANPVPDPPAEAVEAVDQRGSWVEGEVIHPAEGEPFTPDVSGEVSSVIGLTDGRWVLGAYPDGGSFTLVVTDSSGEVLASYDALDGGLTSDDAGGAVSWMGPDSRPMVLLAGGEEPVRLPAEIDGARSPATPIEILPGCGTEECAVIVEVYDDGPDGSTDYAVTLDGEVRSLERLGLLSITDVSPDGALASGVVSADDLTLEYCSAVVVLATGEELWRTCEAGSFRFSPDGSSVLAIDPYLDGPNHSFVQVLDALTGDPLRERLEGIVFDETWTGDGDYLALLGNEDGASVIVRLDLEGPPEQVAGPATGRYPEEPAFRLTGR